MSVDVEWLSTYLKLLRSGKTAESYNYKFSHIPKDLYRYRKDDAHHIENLKNDQDWFSHPCDFNDPFDTCITLSEQQFFNDLKKLVKEKRIEFDIKMSPNDLKIYARENYLNAVQLLNEKFRSETFQICCYSERLFSIPMWAHYAGNHTGFCVAYSNFNMYEGHDLFPVIYSEESTKIRSEFFSDNQVVSDVGALMPILHKYKDWSYEHEWRWLKRTDNKLQPLINPIRTKSPTAIYLGFSCSEQLIVNLKSIAKQKNIPIYKMEADYSKIGLRAKIINDI